ncbi:MAG: hypothetical protein ACM3UT_07970 [Chloroflexota bacterium]
MRKLHILLLSVLLSATVAAQNQPAEIRINTMYLLLGTLSDYMGRFTYIDQPNQVDKYHYFEKPLVEYLDSMIQNDLGSEINVSQKFFNGSYETFSEPLAKTINSRYENNLLKDSIFRTNEEICSFLTGRYYRYGGQLNDSIYKIQLANSPDHNIIEVLLRRIGCTRVHYTFLRNIPAQFIYYFIPTVELKESFSQIKKQKDALNLSYKTAAVSLLGINNEYEKQVRLKNEKDLREIVRLFSIESSGMSVRDSSVVDPH